MRKDWTAIPNFGDEYAKINEEVHAISGAKRIEVLYGARDSAGNPTFPRDRNIDGHGHWIALEIDGMYQMISWRHPVSEGGQQEYGINEKYNALYDLERDIAAKESICLKAENLANSQDWKNVSSSFKQLFDDWKRIYHWGTPKEEQLWERFCTARKSFYENRKMNREKNKIEKQRIVSEAKSLQNSCEWKSTGERFKSLFEEWKQIGSSGKENDDMLWREFITARQSFNDRRSKHYDEMDEQRLKNRQKKQAIISEARSVSQYSENWKTVGDKLQELMSSWKAIGSAGREYEDSLWNEFNSIRQDFFNRRHMYYEAQEREYQNRASQKSRIVQEASSIACSCNYSRDNTERMKELDREWKNIGFSGKNNEDQLWSSFCSAKDSFWTGKRAYHENRQQEHRRRISEAIDRKRQQIYNLEGQISDLEYKMSGMSNQEYISNMCGWIDEKRNIIRELEIAIQDMERELW